MLRNTHAVTVCHCLSLRLLGVYVCPLESWLGLLAPSDGGSFQMVFCRLYGVGRTGVRGSQYDPANKRSFQLKW